MFGLFKKSIHEPVAKQREEIQACNYPDEFKRLLLEGADCDELPGATADFGHNASNPIPVNGLIGTYKYFTKLATAAGSRLYFHRICAGVSSVALHPVDVYETVSMDDMVWDIIFVDMYHPRRSNKAPRGYQLIPYDKKLGDLHYCYGISKQVARFPHDLPQAIGQEMGIAAFERRARERIASLPFHRPSEHVSKLRELSFIPESVQRI